MEQQSDAPMQMLLKTAVAVWIGGLNIFLTIVLVRIWPAEQAAGGLTNEARYLIVTAVAGALGTCIHLSTSFVTYAGKGALAKAWGWWYVLRPGIGAALALVVYFVTRAGLISGAGEASTMSMNPYGVAGIAALSGMFSKQATEKLREVFENLCVTKPQ